MRVHASACGSTRADPAIIELRYDRSLLASEGRPFESDALYVAHGGRKGNYADLAGLPDRRRDPARLFACVDRRAGASREDGDDVIMVVRTTDQSLDRRSRLGRSPSR